MAGARLVTGGLLFDENLSPRLVRLLADLYPGSTSVEDLAMRAASDEGVWEYAVRNGLTIVTRDDDFVDRSVLLGPPPKILWIALGNCSTEQVESLVRWRAAEILAFFDDPASPYLELR